MAFRDWFVSRHTRYLELKILEMAQRHASEIERLTKQHQSELDSAREQVAWAKDEIERLRTFLIPTMKPVYDQVREAHSDEPTPPPDPNAGLSPWQRIQQRELEAQDRAIKERERARADREAAGKQPVESGATPGNN